MSFTRRGQEPAKILGTCKEIYLLIERKRDEIHETWDELSKSGNEPIRRQCLASTYDVLGDILEELPCKPSKEELHAQHAETDLEKQERLRRWAAGE